MKERLLGKSADADDATSSAVVYTAYAAAVNAARATSPDIDYVAAAAACAAACAAARVAPVNTRANVTRANVYDAAARNRKIKKKRLIYG